MNQEAAARTYKRQNYFIDRKFQTRFILKFSALVAMGAGATMLLLYFLSQNSTTVAFIKARVSVMTTADFLFPLLLQTVAIVTVFVGLAAVGVTLFVSHKIAGPLFRFKQTFRELSLGNFSNQVKLRKDDQLAEVATDFNEMITSVRTQVIAANEALNVIQEQIHSIGEANVAEAKRKNFQELKQKVKVLERAILFFRI
ncbi:MAG: methyl-accepting chemotaxis protein [Candidatus Omnitrophica bacterium]|nr:methyl-accepting chemotaxis protein [Candidatus Omnitrophota bacterium]